MKFPLEHFLYHIRGLLAVIALIAVVYSNVYLWFYVPYGGPLVSWEPDSQLTIAAAGDSPLQAGDRVLAINGRHPQRMQPIYALPLQDAYLFTIQRGQQIFTISVPVNAPLNADIVNNYLPTTILSFGGWLLGAIMLLLANSDNWQATHTGTHFLLSAIVLSALQASLEGAPVAWIGGHVLIFPLAVGWIYLATVPRSQPLSSRTRLGFKFLFAIAGLLSGTAVYEVLFLFPQDTSFQELVGLSLYHLGFLLSATGLIACVIILLWRWRRLPQTTYTRRQIAILFFFFAVAILPAVTLTIIPHALFDIVLLPFPLAIALLMLIPTGYLYVIFRQGFLGLDLFFGRALYLLLLTLLIFGFYTTGLHLLQKRLFLESNDALLPAIIVFFPTLLLTIYAARPVNHFVQHLLFGQIAVDQDTLAPMAAALAAKPEMTTLTSVLEKLIQWLHIPQVLLLLVDNKGQLVPVGWVGLDEVPQSPSSQMPNMTKAVRRPSAASDRPEYELFGLFAWAELIVPVSARGELQGVLISMGPEPDGFFNAAQVAFLERAADILAIGSENAALFEAARRLVRQRLAIQEQERKQIAAQIHDDPLQRITYVTSILDKLLAVPPAGFDTPTIAELQKADTHLRKVSTTLRDICAGLHPPFYDQGIELTIKEIVRQYEKEYGLIIETHFALERPLNPVPETVIGAAHRVLVEALNNVVKHACNAQVEITLQQQSANLALRIADNGPGAAIGNLTFSELLKRKHLGLVGMHEWARLVQGELRVELNDPHGTIISMSCPL